MHVLLKEKNHRARFVDLPQHSNGEKKGKTKPLAA